MSGVAIATRFLDVLWRRSHIHGFPQQMKILKNDLQPYEELAMLAGFDHPWTNNRSW